MKFWFVTLVSLVFSLSSCNKGAASRLKCAKEKRQKKNYRVKKLKPYQRGVGGGTAGSSANKQTQQEETVLLASTNKSGGTTESNEESTVEPIETPPIPAILATLDDGTKKIEFKDEVIDLTDEEFVFEKNIRFDPATDKLSEKEIAQLREIADLLKRYSDIKMTIVGNTATTFPSSTQTYGDSKEALDAKARLNGKWVTKKELMLARAKSVYNVLVDFGVDKNQLEYTHGSHRQYDYQRVVTFIVE